MRRLPLLARRLLVAALAMLVGFGVVVGRGAMAEAAVPRLTPPQIADAVLFNDGEAAKYLDSLRRGPTPWTPEIREIQRDIHAAMAEDQYYLRGGFAEAMQSGDPKAIHIALTRLGVTVRTVLERKYGLAQVEKAVELLGKWWSDDRTLRDSIAAHEFDSYRSAATIAASIQDAITDQVNDSSKVQDIATVAIAQTDLHVGEETVVVTDVVLVHDLAVATETVVAVAAAVVAVVAVAFVAILGYGTDMEYGGRTRMAQEVFLAGMARGLRYGGGAR